MNSLQNFANALNESYLNTVESLKYRFSNEINKKTHYIGGELMIPEYEVTRLKLGLRKGKKYYPYKLVFQKWCKKNNLL